MTPPALQGIQVVELGNQRATAYAGKLLQDLGARVTSISAKTTADKAHSLDYELYLNHGKERLSIDFNAAAMPEQLGSLLSRANILLLEPFADSLLATGLTPLQLHEAHPQLLVVSVTAFGLDAPQARAPATDLTLQALGAISIGIGEAGRSPLKLPGDQSAYQAGVTAAIAALGALFNETGHVIDVATTDVWASFYSGVEVANAHFGRGKKGRAGPRVSRTPYPRTLFRCRDGFFSAQCSEKHHWEAFLKMTGQEQLATSPLFANRLKANDEHGDECDQIFEPWFKLRTKQELLTEFLAAKIPGAPVHTIAEVANHPHLTQRGYFQTIQHQGRALSIPTHPFSHATTQTAGSEKSSLSTDKVFSIPQSKPNTGSAGSRPLAGLRVVDFGWVWAGAVPGHILADLGAVVIKVESARPLDYMRQGRPLIGTEKDPEQNPMFHNVNRGKLSLRINLGKPGSTELLQQLIKQSHLVIENFSPGVMTKYGLGWDQLKEVQPSLVMCSMSAVGQTGPLRGIRTYATMIASLAGLDQYVAYPGGRVLGSQSSYADPNASLHATVAILAALWRQKQGGEGQYIDFSQWEATAGVLGEELCRYAVAEGQALAQPTADALYAPYANYRSAGSDQWLAIAVTSEPQWQRLSDALNNPDWMSQDQRFVDNASRVTHRQELDDLLNQETQRFEARALCSALLASGVAAAPLLRDHELIGHPQYQRRQLFEMVEHPSLPPVPVYRLPWQVDGKPLTIARRAPLLGEHNNYVLKNILQLNDSAIKALHSQGTLE